MLYEINDKKDGLKAIWPDIEKLIDNNKVDSCAFIIRLNGGEVLQNFFPGSEAKVNEWIGIAECFKAFLLRATKVEID